MLHDTNTIQNEIVNYLNAMQTAGITHLRRATLHAMLTPTVFGGETYEKTTSAFNYAVKRLMRNAKIERHTFGRETRYSLV